MEKSKSKKFDIVGIGICCVDHLHLLEQYPDPDSKVEALDTSIQGGGPVPTALCAASRLGASSAFAGVVGDDSDGSFIIDELSAFRVDVEHVIRKDNTQTSRASIWIDSTNHTRNVVLDRRHTAMMTPEDIDEGLMRNARIIHMDGRDVEICIEAAKLAKAEGAEVSLDVGSAREGVEHLLPYVDHLVVSSTFAYDYCDTHDIEQCIKAFQRHALKSCVVTCSNEGSLGWESGIETLRQRAFNIDEVIDTTGAGDVYHGGYLFGLANSWDLKTRMEFASAAAALACSKLGGRAGIPSFEEVMGLIRSSCSPHW